MGKEPHIKRKVTQAEIARLLGISRQAVGYALGRNPKFHGEIGQDTRERILQTARELGYQPNEVARSMVCGRTRTIGVLEFLSSRIFGREALANLAKILKQAGWRMHLALREAGDFQAEDDYINDMLSQQAEGLLIVVDPLRDPAYYRELRARNVPMVVSGSPFERSEVWIDSTSALYDATMHLIALGHRRIVYAVWEGLSQKYPLHRVHGFLRAAQEAGLPSQQDWVPVEDQGREDIQTFTQQVLRANPRPTAIMYTNDEDALVGLHTILGLGLRVPQDVSIVGFDDLPLAQFICPELTTVRQPVAALHREMFRILLDRIEHGPQAPSAHLALKADLIVRQSTGPAPSGTE